MRLEQYIAISILVVLSTILALVVIFASRILGPKKPTEKKLTPYESGMTPIGPAVRRLQARRQLLCNRRPRLPERSSRYPKRRCSCRRPSRWLVHRRLRFRKVRRRV